MRIAIIGSREYRDSQAVIDFVDSLPEDTVIVSGGAPGVDQIAETAAKRRGLERDIKPADWARFGKAAGIIRNKDIVAACDELVAFWDGKSPGTADSIMTAHKTGKKVTVFLQKPREPDKELF